ncbi:hypothetical protein [Salinimicrobium sediminilitoris]|uniref:hypothetical protein n=1 Tax=Salinimicrobium sediminilitoris TaxID=2876715 RepID=UPI001E28759B|nr:hypothetical protein [Salinimicrobium sediminilitoris]MCC8360047.1 hypothetical protein [Salinimicrobium sediminilitoris]
MTKFLFLLFLCLLTTSCIDDEMRRPIPGGAPQEKEFEEIKAVAHLPVHIDSTKYLLHPVGELGEERSEYFGSGGSSGGHVYQSSDVIKGRMSNIKFQQIDSEELVPLTNGRVVIYSVEFLRSIFENTGKQFLIYEMRDRDTNGDENLDGEDANSLYISNINGENFRKLTPKGQHLLQLTVVDEMNRLYFKTSEDSNGDGHLDNKDRQHLFYIDLAVETPKVVEYDPLKK